MKKDIQELDHNAKRIYYKLTMICKLLKIDFWDLRKYHEVSRPKVIAKAINQIVSGAVISEYTAIDEELRYIILADFQIGIAHPDDEKRKKAEIFEEKFLKNVYLLKKLELVKNLLEFPEGMCRKIEAVNRLRNKVAHEIMPSHQYYYEEKAITFLGSDIFTTRGVEKFLAVTKDIKKFLSKEHWRIIERNEEELGHPV